MSRSFVRHSFKVGNNSRFVIYQKPDEYAAFKIGQWLAYIFLILPLKIIHYLSSTVLKLVLNGIIAFVFWIKELKNPAARVVDDEQLESIYSIVGNFADIVGYLCELIVIIFVISSVVSSFKDGGSKDNKKELTAEERVELLEKSLGTSAEVSSDVEKFIKENEVLFKEKVKSSVAKEKSAATIKLSDYCNNLDAYDGKFLRIKKATVDSVRSSRGMKVVQMSYSKDNLVNHSLYVYFYCDVDVDDEDKVTFYAYPIQHENIFMDESLANQGIETGSYEDYLVGSRITKHQNRRYE